MSWFPLISKGGVFRGRCNKGTIPNFLLTVVEEEEDTLLIPQVEIQLHTLFIISNTWRLNTHAHTQRVNRLPQTGAASIGGFATLLKGTPAVL